MDLHPRLTAAADMCEQGEEINLDEVALLLRYASDELNQHESLKREHRQLCSALAERLQARMSLLNWEDETSEPVHERNVEQLMALEKVLDREIRSRFPVSGIPVSGEVKAGSLEHQQFRCG